MAKCKLLWLCLLVGYISLLNDVADGQTISSANRRQQLNNRNKLATGLAILKDAFHEDSSFVVRIRTIYNQTTSITCNAVLMEEQLVLSDVTCIKYQGMANIDAKFVQVIAGEANNESVYEVEQIFINKADPKDPGTELALLRLSRPLRTESQCKHLIRPERNHSIEYEAPVRVIGFTTNYELKENRTRVAKRAQAGKYICTTPAEGGDSPGLQLLKGAPLLHMVDCKQFQLVGILTKTEVLPGEPSASGKRYQDCYVMVSSQIRWYDQVKALSSLAAKNGLTETQPSVITVTVNDDSDEIQPKVDVKSSTDS